MVVTHSRVLMIAYHFPPDMEVGARRTARFVKYLSTMGWEPVVLSVNEHAYDSLDKTAPSLSGVSIYRTSLISGPREWANLIKRIVHRKSTEEAGISGSGNSVEHGYIPPEKIFFLKRIFFSLMWLPDDKQGWLLPAALKAIKLLRLHQIDVLYTTGPPWTNHLVGLLISLFTRKPWIADFRDPWVGGRTKPVFVRSWLSDRIDTILEWCVMHRATGILCMCERQRNQLLSDHPKLDLKMIHVIPNGFDPDEISQTTIDSSTKSDSLLMTYAGKLYSARDPENLFRALQKVLAQGILPPNQLRVRFFGKCTHVNGLPISEIAARYDLQNVIQAPGELPRSECLAELGKSDLLLLLAMEQKDQVPAKLFEYLMTGKPILVFTEEDSATAEVVRETGGGVLVNMNDAAAVEETLKSLFEKYRVGTLSAELDPVALSHYSAVHLTQALSNLMDSTLNRRPDHVRAGSIT